MIGVIYGGKSLVYPKLSHLIPELLHWRCTIDLSKL